MKPIRIVEEIEVSNLLLTIDLNGTKVNFETKFQVSSKPQGERYVIAVVSQTELDSGDFTFEECEADGTYTRKIIRQDDKHQNYFIAIKKHPKDKDKDGAPLKCTVVKELRELPENKVFALPKRELEEIKPQDRQPTFRNQDTNVDVADPNLVVLEKENELVRVERTDDTSNVQYMFLMGVVLMILALYMIQQKK